MSVRNILSTLSAVSLAISVPMSVAQQVGSTSTAVASQPVEFDLYLPLQNRDGLQTFLDSLHSETSPQYRKWITPQEFQQRFGPSAGSVTAAQKELANLGLTVTATSPQTLHVSGSSAVVQRPFSTRLEKEVPSNGQSKMVSAKPKSRTVPNLALLMGGCPAGAVFCNPDDGADLEIPAALSLA